jgi:hypothetical protein
MAKYKVTLTVDLKEDAKAPDWIIQSVEEQLEEGECISSHNIELATDLSKAAKVMEDLLIEGDVMFRYKDDSVACDCYYETSEYGMILIEGDVINFVDHGPNFVFNVNEEFEVTCLNDFVAEISNH